METKCQNKFVQGSILRSRTSLRINNNYMVFFLVAQTKLIPFMTFNRVYKNTNKIYFVNYFSIVSFSQLHNPGGK